MTVQLPTAYTNLEWHNAHHHRQTNRHTRAGFSIAGVWVSKHPKNSAQTPHSHKSCGTIC